MKRTRPSIIVAVLLVFPAAAWSDSIRYVDDVAAPGGNGLSWETAYNDLQDALADRVDEIRVAQGTYSPGAAREDTFYLWGNKAILGGYRGLGGGGDPNDRDVDAFETVLSGDIGVAGDDSDNSYHVVTGSSTSPLTMLDGFTIADGNADGTGNNRYGGGLYNDFGHEKLINCTFRRNSAITGGGMYSVESLPTLIDCTFIENCAVSSGGGMYNREGDPRLTNCTFRENSSAQGGGGMYSELDAAPVLINCDFIQNSSGVDGGGMCNSSGSDAVLTGCVFSLNATAYCGGGMRNYLSDSKLTNCVFAINTAEWGGGGLYDYGGVERLTNCTFYANRTDDCGGGIYSVNAALLNLDNCILWDNTASEGGAQIELDGASVYVTYSCIEGGWAGTGNINADPLFSDAYGRLSYGSPCIDAGDSGASGLNGVAVDADGHVRRSDDPVTPDSGAGSRPIVDMGAYEWGDDCNADGISDMVETGPLAGHALLFDGVDDYANVLGSQTGPLAEIGQGDFTLEVWVRTSSAEHSILAGNNIADPEDPNTGVFSWNLEIHDCSPEGHVCFRFNDGEPHVYHGVAQIADGQWRHVVAVRTVGPAGIVRIYVDGVLDLEVADPSEAFTVESATMMAVGPGAGRRFWGMLDDIRIWSIAREQNEIVADMYRTLDGDEPGLAAYWRFDEGAGMVAGDAVGDYTALLIPPPNPPFVYPPTWIFQSTDCNGNGALDECDIESGFSEDCNANGLPDECEVGGLVDCNGNDVSDLCDLYEGVSEDCNGNGVPDECEVGGLEDCNGNDVPDLCDIYEGISEDCNANGVPDECDITEGLRADCNANGVLDECESLPAGVFYVDDDATGLNDGSSWGDACTSLADVLSYADCSGLVTEIRIAGGTYLPGADRSDAFKLVTGVAVYGGYRGLSGGGDPDDRDVTAFLTILSGDIGTPDVAEDNCYHVVTGSGTDASAILDGVMIISGYADGSDAQGGGGGMYTNAGSPTVTNCKFSGNWAARDGGGMYNDDSSPVVTGCTFTDNSTHDDGAGMLNIRSNPTVTNCTFTDNAADDDGGGMLNYLGDPTVTDCTFTGNTADEGGGICNSSAAPTLIDCNFTENSANAGAGIGNLNAAPTITNCVFTGNSADYGGGGIYNDEGSLTLTDCSFNGNSARNGGGMYQMLCSATLSNCSFSGNSAEVYGGGMSSDLGNYTLTNCTFTNNSAAYGGGMDIFCNNPTLTNCTFVDNSAGQSGGGLQCKGTVSTVTNCVVWGNAAPSGSQIYEQDSTVAVNYSCIQGDLWPGPGNINDDPLFADPDGPDDDPDTWEDNDYRLGADSPCIDAADNSAVPADVLDLDGDGDTSELLPIDLDSRLRFADRIDVADVGLPHPDFPNLPVVDMGACEYQCAGDLNGDGEAGLSDLAELLSHYGLTCGAAYGDGDLNGDGEVTLSDLAALLSVYGTACE